jgi:hypothetical protein
LMGGMIRSASLRAFMPANWIARNVPLSMFSLTVFSAATAERLPATKPTRQPVMQNALLSEKNSTATSSAPGTWRMLGAR